jgi:hypothetical protein
MEHQSNPVSIWHQVARCTVPDLAVGAEVISSKVFALTTLPVAQKKCELAQDMLLVIREK